MRYYGCRAQEEDVTLAPAAIEILTKIGTETSLRKSILPYEQLRYETDDDFLIRLRDSIDHTGEFGRSKEKVGAG